MPDWKAIAEARKLAIPEESIAEVTPILDALESAFRPLVEQIPFRTEPAVTLSEQAVAGE